MMWANRGWEAGRRASNGSSLNPGRTLAIRRQYLTRHLSTPLCDTRRMSRLVRTGSSVSVPWPHHRGTLSPLIAGIGDPTARSSDTTFTFARHRDVVHLNWICHEGSTTYVLSHDDDRLLRCLVGSDYMTPPSSIAHEAVRRAARRHRALRIAGNGEVFPELVKAVLGQRITARDATAQWARLVRASGRILEHPWGDPLWSTPDPEAVCSLTVADFHRMGVERRRAHTIRLVADLARRGVLDSVSSMRDVRAVTRDVVGCGPWTLAVAAGNAFGDADALPVGDFHLKNTVSWALTQRPRGTDDEMLAHLEPYAGSRWWVVRCLSLDYRAPRFSHRRVNPDFRSW